MNVNEAIESIGLVKRNLQIVDGININEETERNVVKWIKWLGKKSHIDGVENSEDRKGEVLIGFTVGHNMLSITVGEKGISGFMNRDGDKVYDQYNSDYVMGVVNNLAPVIPNMVKVRVKNAYLRIKNLNSSIKLKLEMGSYTCGGKVEEVKELVGTVPVENGDYEILVDVKMTVSGVPIVGRCGVLLSDIEGKKSSKVKQK